MSPPKSDGIASRKASLKCLKSVIIDGKSLDQVKPQAYASLTPQDAKFAHALTLTTLRNYGPHRDVLSRYTKKSGRIKPAELQIILQMGIAQILHLDVPDHAAVDTTLKLAIKSGLIRQKGFINAVLRKITSDKANIVLRHDIENVHYPEWLIKEWIKDYGREETGQMIPALMSEPSLDLTIPDHSTRQTFLDHYGDQCLPIGAHGVRFKNPQMNVQDLLGFKDGQWWVQNAASAFPISYLIEHKIMPKPWSEIKALDLCAAPGGKTMQLAQTGAHITALDLSEQRLQRLSENLERTNLIKNVDIIAGDALTHEGSYDLIVLDAPCTATGTLRRHPDAAFSKTKAQMKELATLQQRMLTHASTLLKDDGILVFCTCALQHEEGENTANQFTSKNSSFKILAFKGRFEQDHVPNFITKEGYFRSLPHHAPLYGDGFFSALLKKI